MLIFCLGLHFNLTLNTEPHKTNYCTFSSISSLRHLQSTSHRLHQNTQFPDELLTTLHNHHHHPIYTYRVYKKIYLFIIPKKYTFITTCNINFNNNSVFLEFTTCINFLSYSYQFVGYFAIHSNILYRT